MNVIKHGFALNQLIYTSFTDVGFALLTSEQVPLQIQQTFLKQIVYQHWNAFERENQSYRAAYLFQVTLEHCLFGWLYNNEWDDIDRTHIPYFICYHLTEPLYALAIEKVCACLQKGPVKLVDRHSFSNSVEPLTLKDVSSYQEAKPGVLISWETRQQIHTNLKQGILTNLFIPVKEKERGIELSLPVQPQELVTTDNSADDHSLIPLIPVKEKERGIELSLPVQPQELVTTDNSADNHSLIPLIPVKEKERGIELSLPVQPQELIAKDNSADNHSLALDRNSILLLGISFGIITGLAVTVLIYVFLHMTSVLNQPTQSPSQSALPLTAPAMTKVSQNPE
ncbi:hypothetical protein [Mastigocladopsis repens]|uniref:hypothetical protein n=1 Tax=Mastigocladopsis repens TaxID=221287 RepID=UPI000300B686|nr:hypothetical protein [Mastigocladopsis repens]